MTSANRLQVSLVRESTVGTTPTTPRMRIKRITGEGLKFDPTYVDSDEIRPDRMSSDPIRVLQGSSGTINDELCYPDDESPDSELYRSLFYNTWTNTPARYNDGTADSVITGIASGVVTVTTGASFVTRHLVRFTGFDNAANNGVFRCTTGSATVPAFSAASLVDDATPAAAARMKVVGLVGASGDITATATGLGSTALNFTLFGLQIGQWINIGGGDVTEQFATTVLNDWARITAISATALTLDNKPGGWTTDSGAGKSIKIWFGDMISNGLVQTGMTIEKGFLGQTTPVYIVNSGMVVSQCAHTVGSGAKITRNWTFLGMGGGESTTSLDNSPDAQTTGRVMAGSANVGRITEGGTTLRSPNYGRSMNFTINNNLRSITTLDNTSPVATREGEFGVSGTVESYFGNDRLLAKFYAGTATSLSTRIQKDSQAIIFNFPRVTLRGNGNPAVTGKNTDVMASFDWTASKDSLTSAHAIMNRVEYFELAGD